MLVWGSRCTASNYKTGRRRVACPNMGWNEGYLCLPRRLLTLFVSAVLASMGNMLRRGAFVLNEAER